MPKAGTKKIKFIAYINIPVIQNRNENLIINAKIEVVTNLHAFFFLVRNFQSDCSEPWFIMTSMTSLGSMLL